MKQLACITLLLLVLAGCQEASTTDTQAGKEKLMQASRDWSEAAGARNLEKTLSYWDDNAVMISSGQPVIEGKEGIRKMVEGSYQDSSFKISWEPKKAEVSESGDMGYLLEDAVITMTDSTGNPVQQRFKTVTVWKKGADGQWKNVVDVMSPLPE